LHLDILRDLRRIHSHICSVAYPVLEAAGELPARESVAGEAATDALAYPPGLPWLLLRALILIERHPSCRHRSDQLAKCGSEIRATIVSRLTPLGLEMRSRLMEAKLKGLADLHARWQLDKHLEVLARLNAWRNPWCEICLSSALPKALIWIVLTGPAVMREHSSAQ
jgi:hypothetical protein